MFLDGTGNAIRQPRAGLRQQLRQYIASVVCQGSGELQPSVLLVKRSVFFLQNITGFIVGSGF